MHFRVDVAKQNKNIEKYLFLVLVENKFVHTLLVMIN